MDARYSLEERPERLLFVRRECRRKVFVKSRLDGRLGDFQPLCLFGRVKQPTAPVRRILAPDEIPLCFEALGTAGDRRLVGVQKFRNLRLRRTRMVPQRVNVVDLRRADAALPERVQHELLRLPRNLCHLSFRNIQNPRVLSRFNRCTYNHFSTRARLVNHRSLFRFDFCFYVRPLPRAGPLSRADAFLFRPPNPRIPYPGAFPRRDVSASPDICLAFSAFLPNPVPERIHCIRAFCLL